MPGMLGRSSRLRLILERHWASFSYVGLAVATLFFAASLSPSLLPRHFAVQGILSGFALAAGYGIGVLLVWLWNYLEIRHPSAQTQRMSKRITTVSVALVAVLFLWRASIWQNSIRQLMEMDAVETAYPWRVGLIALVTGVLLIATARGLRNLWRYVDRKVSRYVPRRVSNVASALIVIVGVYLVVNHAIARLALNAADAVFLQLDEIVDDGIEQPEEATFSGSPESLVEWDHIGRWGKQFVAAGPTQESIGEFWGAEAMRPLRVYVGLGAKESVEERAKLALQELIRVGGFDRSTLIVATPTGTGWLDPGAVDTIEYLHKGDTAIVTMQYSYLPSWLTVLVDPTRSHESAVALFNEVYDHWKTLPQSSRPKLYLHGLSLGALGSAASADLITIFEDPIQGAVWSGPPFPSAEWNRATRYRNPDSPMWLPRFRDGSMLRFTGRENSLSKSGDRWGPMRIVYIQHASDPMTFFAPELLYRKPEWLTGERGPDVSPYLRWYPVVTFLQAGFDLPMATAVPTGYGHNFGPSSYIDAWIEVTQPKSWDDDDTTRLKVLFTNTAGEPASAGGPEDANPLDGLPNMPLGGEAVQPAAEVPANANRYKLDAMNITSRYSDDPSVTIDAANVPAEFQHLLPLAKEWSIGDDEELEAYIEAAPTQKKQELVAAFSPHFDDLWKWHQSCEDMIPQPDELVLFDTAANCCCHCSQHFGRRDRLTSI